MILRQKLFIIFLWLAVINLSIWIGGTLFHMIVVLPIWSHPLPGSVKEFFGGTNEAIMAKAGEGSSPDEIRRMVSNWILADRLRFAIIFIGYFFLLWAFRLPISLAKKTPGNATLKT